LNVDKKKFQNLSNKERSEIYADLKIHNEIYLSDDFSISQRIHNQRFESLLKLMGDISNKKILDAGSGEGLFLSTLNTKYTFGIELSEKRTKKALQNYPNLSISVADVKNLPFSNDSFDVIVCSEVLEHVSEYKKAIDEFKRCIKPNGLIVLSFPNEFTVCIGRFLTLKFPAHEIDHINSIKPKDITELLGQKYTSLNVPNLPYPFCLYQVYCFNALNFK
jgi:2-polyprenyl-3-methyl-5-hydroxy-6-metoxy-1,4-benzoquinol methylase